MTITAKSMNETKLLVSGGEIPAEQRAAYIALRDKIQREPDVLRVFELSLRTDGSWMYFIQTPFVTFPKFVIGLTDADNESPEVVFRSGAKWSASAAWDRLRHGKGAEE